MVDAAFAQRRKTLRSTLKQLAGSAAAAEAALAHAGVDPMARGEALRVEQFARDRRRAGGVTGTPGGTVAVSAPAKINLSLGVGPRRADGYHSLATVYQAVGLYDQVTVHDADEVTVAMRGRRAGCRRPTCRPTRRTSRCGPRCCSRSTTASTAAPPSRSTRASRSPAGWPAAAPTGPRRCWPATRSGGCTARARSCVELAAELGSDVPFALLGGTAIGSGRGEVVTPLMTSGEYWWVVLESDRGLSTPEVYAEFDAMTGRARLGAGDPRRADARAARPRRRRPRRRAVQRPPAGRAAAAARAGHRARAGPPRVRATARSCPAPGPAACSCARAARTPRRSPPASVRRASDRCRSPPARCTAPGSWPAPATRRAEVAVVPNLVSLERVQQGVRRPAAAVRGEPRRRRGGADRRRRPQRRRQDHAAAGGRRPRAARRRPGLPQPRAAPGLPHPGRRPRADGHACARRCCRAAPTTSGPPTPGPARSSRCCSPASPSTGRRRAVRRRAAAVLAGPAAARRPRPGDPRRADQPPRRRGRRLAGAAPAAPYVRAGGGHPRPLVPRRGVLGDVGGARRRRRRVRRRLRGVRAGQGRAAAAGGRDRDPAAQPDAQGAGLAAARPAGEDLEAEVPHRGREHADRGRAAAARPAGAAAVRDAAARQGRRRRRGRRPGPRRADAAVARDVAAGPR